MLPTKYTADGCLCSHSQNLLVRALQSVAPRLWKSLTPELRLVDSVDSFKKLLKSLNGLSVQNLF